MRGQAIEREALAVFAEPIDHDVSNSVPCTLETRGQIIAASDHHSRLLDEQAQRSRVPHRTPRRAAPRRAAQHLQSIWLDRYT